MTYQAPLQPAPFRALHPQQVAMPNPRTVRAEDLSWFNTRGGEIIQTNYNTCTGQMNAQRYPWNRAPCPKNFPFWTCPIPRFDLYGLAGTCPCELNRCGCSNCYQKKRCALYGGSYVDSN
jgi:hypothetical protein